MVDMHIVSPQWLLRYLGSAHATDAENTLPRIHFPSLSSYRFALGRPSVTLAHFGKLSRRGPTAKCQSGHRSYLIDKGKETGCEGA
jgi:hypothetical protein